MIPIAVNFVNNHKPTYNYGRNIDINILKTLTNENQPVALKNAILRKYTKINDLLYYCERATGKQDAVLGDMDAYVTVNEWKRSKQIYRFDANFLSELINTDSFHFQKDIWKHLPVNCFYIDISASEDLCEKLDCSGLFIRLNPAQTEAMWQIHTLSIKPDTDISVLNIFYAWNEDRMISTDDYDEIAKIAVPNAKDYDKERNEQTDIKNRTMYTIICQILTYMSSAEPDINESNEECIVKVKEPARKNKKRHNPEPKELRTWNVGYRYGEAFRKWETDKQHSISNPTDAMHTTKRPHYRRAHWHSFWYGKRDEERVKRVRWVSGILVNKDNIKYNNNLPAVIHIVEQEDIEVIKND